MANSKESVSALDAENLCVVCCKNVEIYSVGVCDHPVCFECSTRMRVLCNQNECPICRGQMPKVIFSKDVALFTALFAHFQTTNSQDRKFGLIFCSDEIKKAYQKLLEFRCTICAGIPKKRFMFYTFHQLKEHMRKEHDLHYCDLCVENLKIFPFERRCYTFSDLKYHLRKGDVDDTSHKGHPLCDFCVQRFMDRDELFRHLRRIHYYCHFCDADGKHQYYPSIHDLQKHFQDEHYLCQEGECCNEPLTAVFRTEIDLKAHIATQHGRHMSKSASKQARTLELEFTLAPRPGTDRRRQAAAHVERNDEEGAVGYDTEPGGPGGGIKQVHSLTPKDFPALGNSTVTVQSRPTTTVNFTSKLNPFSSEEFPSLGGSRAPAVTITTDSSSSRKKGSGVTITSTLRGSSAQNLKKNAENFPCLGPPSSATTSTVHLSLNNVQNSTPNVSIHVNHNGAITTHITSTSSHSNGFNINQKPVEAFPALGNTTVPLNPQWVQQKSKKQHEPRVGKVAPAPALPPSDLSQFPTLSKTKNEKNPKKSSSVTVPVSGTWASSSKAISSNSNNGNSSRVNKSAEASDSRSKSKKHKKKPSSSAGEGDRVEKRDDSKKESESDANKEENEWGGEKNGIVKKRSELKIGSLTLNEAANAQPPPGFGVKPPPGFNFSGQNFPGLGSNDLTFTNSSGQSYSIKPNNYQQPSNFMARNQNLIKRAKNVLNDETMKEFKTYSTKFREGDMSAEQYYEYCRALLSLNFKHLFPELLVLLPDIEKQQDLYRVCDRDSKRNLVVCENCSQVIFKNELGDHYNYHVLENQFPCLSEKAEVASAWRK